MTTQDSFNHLMSQFNWAILEWSRFRTSRGVAKVEFFQQARQMLIQAFPEQAQAYEQQQQESEVQHA